MPSQTFDAYWRGMLQRAHPRATHPGFVKEALNVAFLGGRPRSRPGLHPFHGAPCSGIVRGLGWHVKASGIKELLSASGAAFERIPQGGDPIAIPQLLPSTTPARVEQDRVFFLSLSGGNNLTLIYDGFNLNLKYDGNQITQLGVPVAPTPAVPVVSPVGGFITPGNRKYRMTLDTPNHEGNPSVDERDVNFPDGSTTQSATFPSPTNLVDYDDPQVTQWRLFRTVDGGQDYFFIGSADIGVSITDTIADDVLDTRAALEEFVNALPPAPFRAMVEHRGQVFGVATDDINIVHHSSYDPQYMVPEGWPTDRQTPIAHGDGDEITALVSFHEWLVIFKRQSTWAMQGNDLDGWEVTPVLAAGGGHRIGIGTLHPSSIVQIENQVIFASRDGIYAISRFVGGGGIEAKRLSGPIDELYAAANFEFSAATSFDRKRRLFVLWGHG